MGLIAFVMQVGNWASAYFTVVIAVHTFNSLVLKKRQSILISLPAITIGWAVAATVGEYSDQILLPMR